MYFLFIFVVISKNTPSEATFTSKKRHRSSINRESTSCTRTPMPKIPHCKTTVSSSSKDRKTTNSSISDLLTESSFQSDCIV